MSHPWRSLQPTNQPTYATDINIVKEIKGDAKNQP